jgi:hypothetical protein
LVSTRTIAARETQTVFTQRAESLRAGLGSLNLGSVQAGQRESESAPRGPWARDNVIVIRMGGSDAVAIERTKAFQGALDPTDRYAWAKVQYPMDALRSLAESGH